MSRIRRCEITMNTAVHLGLPSGRALLSNHPVVCALRSRFSLSFSPTFAGNSLPRDKDPSPAFSPDFSPAFSPWPGNQPPPVSLHLKLRDGNPGLRHFSVFYFLPDGLPRLAVTSGQRYAKPKLRSGCSFDKAHEVLKVKFRWLIFGLSMRIR